jgi:hypothetical protein
VSDAVLARSRLYGLAVGRRTRAAEDMQVEARLGTTERAENNRNQRGEAHVLPPN